MSSLGGFNPLRKIDQEREDLEKLIEVYNKRAAELGQREDRVMREIQMAQSAVASLQSWNEAQKQKNQTPSERIDLKTVEEETEKIREETKRIQEEINEKIALNKKLRKEVDKKRENERRLSDRVRLENRSRSPSSDTGEGENRATYSSRGQSSTDDEDDLGLSYFNGKLKKLIEMERKLKMESEQELEYAKLYKNRLVEKIEKLERETEIDKTLFQSMKKKLERE